MSVSGPDVGCAAVQITACGYTISPLQPRYASGPPECLVTMVLKVRPELSMQ